MNKDTSLWGSTSAGTFNGLEVALVDQVNDARDSVGEVIEAVQRHAASLDQSNASDALDAAQNALAKMNEAFALLRQAEAYLQAINAKTIKP